MGKGTDGPGDGHDDGRDPGRGEDVVWKGLKEERMLEQ